MLGKHFAWMHLVCTNLRQLPELKIYPLLPAFALVVLSLSAFLLWLPVAGIYHSALKPCSRLEIGIQGNKVWVKIYIYICAYYYAEEQWKEEGSEEKSLARFEASLFLCTPVLCNAFYLQGVRQALGSKAFIGILDVRELCKRCDLTPNTIIYGFLKILILQIVASRRVASPKWNSAVGSRPLTGNLVLHFLPDIYCKLSFEPDVALGPGSVCQRCPLASEYGLSVLVEESSSPELFLLPCTCMGEWTGSGGKECGSEDQKLIPALLLRQPSWSLELELLRMNYKVPNQLFSI